MAIFNRKKDESVLPEVDQYYQGERRDRTWLAWVLAVLSIAVVVLLLVGLFFAGKWTYNKITDNDEDSTVATTQQEGENLPSFDGGSTDNNQPDTTNNSDQEGNETPDSGTDDSSEGTVDAPARTTTPSNPSSSTNVNGVAGKSTDLPNTGPEGITAVFAASAAVATAGHYVVSRRRK